MSSNVLCVVLYSTKKCSRHTPDTLLTLFFSPEEVFRVEKLKRCLIHAGKLSIFWMVPPSFTCQDMAEDLYGHLEDCLPWCLGLENRSTTKWLVHEWSPLLEELVSLMVFFSVNTHSWGTIWLPWALVELKKKKTADILVQFSLYKNRWFQALETGPTHHHRLQLRCPNGDCNLDVSEGLGG